MFLINRAFETPQRSYSGPLRTEKLTPIETSHYTQHKPNETSCFTRHKLNEMSRYTRWSLNLLTHCGTESLLCSWIPVTRSSITRASRWLELPSFSLSSFLLYLDNSILICQKSKNTDVILNTEFQVSVYNTLMHGPSCQQLLSGTGHYLSPAGGWGGGGGRRILRGITWFLGEQEGGSVVTDSPKGGDH